MTSFDLQLGLDMEYHHGSVLNQSQNDLLTFLPNPDATVQGTTTSTPLARYLVWYTHARSHQYPLQG